MALAWRRSRLHIEVPRVYTYDDLETLRRQESMLFSAQQQQQQQQQPEPDMSSFEEIERTVARAQQTKVRPVHDNPSCISTDVMHVM